MDELSDRINYFGDVYDLIPLEEYADRILKIAYPISGSPIINISSIDPGPADQLDHLFMAFDALQTAGDIEPVYVPLSDVKSAEMLRLHSEVIAITTRGVHHWFCRTSEGRMFKIWFAGSTSELDERMDVEIVYNGRYSPQLYSEKFPLVLLNNELLEPIQRRHVGPTSICYYGNNVIDPKR